MTMHAVIHPDQHEMREHLERSIARAVESAVATMSAEQALPHVAWQAAVHVAGGDVEVLLDGPVGIEFTTMLAGDVVQAYASRWGTGNVECGYHDGVYVAMAKVEVGGLASQVWGAVTMRTGLAA